MAVVNLRNEGEEIITGNDNIVIVDIFQSIRGGRSLDVTGFKPNVIKAGHVIIKDTATGDYKPMPVTEDGAIATLGAVTGGTGYTNGNYNSVALAGGAGIGAIANITVGSNAVTAVTIVNGGSGYKAADVLTANITGGSGFSVPVATISNAGYAALPANHTYAGILIASILTKRAFAGILVRGTVNPAAAPYPMSGILAAVKTALPLIDFRED
jgi:hypothetical protein